MRGTRFSLGHPNQHPRPRRRPCAWNSGRRPSCDCPWGATTVPRDAQRRAHAIDRDVPRRPVGSVRGARFEPLDQPGRGRRPEGAVRVPGPEGVLPARAVHQQRQRPAGARSSSSLPNRAAWDAFLQARRAAAGPVAVFIDPRSGAATNIIGRVPLIPGSGVGNRVTLAALGERLGRAVEAVDAAVVADAVAALRPGATGSCWASTSPSSARCAPRRSRPTSGRCRIPQQVGGVPVRDGRLAATISHGNLVVIGTETWGDVARACTAPRSAAEQALDAGFALRGRPHGRTTTILRRAGASRSCPSRRPSTSSGEAFAGPVGAGYGHRLVWTFVVPAAAGARALGGDGGRAQRRGARLPGQEPVRAAPDHGRRLPAHQHRDLPERRRSAAPCSPAGRCPSPTPASPRPTTSPTAPASTTTRAAPSTTTLTGRFVHIADTCGAISDSSATGDIDLGGANGQHDCTTRRRRRRQHAGLALGLLRGQQDRRAWRAASCPPTPGSNAQLTANVNINQHLQRLLERRHRQLLPLGRRLPEHRRDRGRVRPRVGPRPGRQRRRRRRSATPARATPTSRPSTACRPPAWATASSGRSTGGCGLTADGTGFNAERGQTARPHCDTDCSGVRDADWAKHADQHAGHARSASSAPRCGTRHRPLRPAGPLRGRARAPGGLGPGGARPARPRPSTSTARPRSSSGNKLFYQGSGNIGAWHACTCGGTSDGCGATNGYMQWLAADDDNGNLNDGTPHMTAIFDAFNRHGIACATPGAQQQRLRGRADRGAHADRHAGQLPGRAVLDRRRRARPATGCSAPRATPAATSARR